MSRWDVVDPATGSAEPGAMDPENEPQRYAELAGQLRHAFVAGELTAYYQPEYDVATRAVVAVEALCRWQHPQHGLLLPDRFIDVAERYGLIADVGRFMLEESGGRAADWRRRGVDVSVSINVSPSELVPSFARLVLGHAQRLGLPRNALTVEITESPALEVSRRAVRTLERLIDGGIGVSVDDFGIGHTSLDLLSRMPLTEVKIDRSLVHQDSARTADLVQRCLEIARRRGAIVVAEGVENDTDFARVRAWGVDRAQGYFFAPPLPTDDVERLLIAAS